MPWRPKRVCTWPGCRRLVAGRRCPEHDGLAERLADRRRPSAARRGYTRRWARYARAYLAEHPVCVRCGRASEQVDHVRAVTGPEDEGFWNEANHQALCRRCHSSKTAREDGGFRGRGG